MLGILKGLGERKMKDYKCIYEKLKDEFETYQNFAEGQIQLLNERNVNLEKNLDALVNIVEISKYINSYVSDDNLIPMINDMIIGILGVTYSSIYLKEDDDFKIKATNIKSERWIKDEYEYLNEIEMGSSFVLNSKDTIFGADFSKEEIHSIIGVPIKLGEKFMGYIIVEHALWNFFNYEHVKFVSSIANQIAIAIENSILYKELQELAKRDPLLNIYNRRYFFEVLKSKFEESNNKGAVVMIDFDNFKKANDNYGHQYGDEVLIATLKLIKENLNSKDIIARYGGEEIVIYIHREDKDDPREVHDRIDKIRELVEKNQVGPLKVKITASFGISYYPEDGTSVEGIVNKSDSCLYVAKGNGKNQVISTLNDLNTTNFEVS